MKNNIFITILALVALVSAVMVGTIGAASLAEEGAEPKELPQRDPAQAQEAMRMLGTTGLLLIPDELDLRIMAFDPITGDLVDPNFIPPDPANLFSPINIILSPSGNSFLISDANSNLVIEYDLTGNFVGIFAPAGGADLNIMETPRAITLRPNGNLLVPVGAGPNANAVAEFDTNGNFLGNFIEPGDGGLGFPADIYQRDDEWLVSDARNGKVLRFALETGDFIGELAPINQLPLQLAETSTGNVLVANLTGDQEGIVELSPTGSVVDVIDPDDMENYQGVYELPNGNFLVTANDDLVDNDGVFEISRAGALVDTKISGPDAILIEYVSLAPDFSNSSKDAPATAETGSRFTYTIVIDNSSDTPALNASLDDPIPAGLTYVYGSVTGGAVFEAAANKIKWTGDVAPNSAVTITFEVDVTAESGWITNTASIFHAATGLVDVSATTNIVPEAEPDFEIYLPVVLKP